MGNSLRALRWMPLLLGGHHGQAPMSHCYSRFNHTCCPMEISPARITVPYTPALFSFIRTTAFITAGSCFAVSWKRLIIIHRLSRIVTLTAAPDSIAPMKASYDSEDLVLLVAW